MDRNHGRPTEQAARRELRKARPAAASPARPRRSLSILYGLVRAASPRRREPRRIRLRRGSTARVSLLNKQFSRYAFSCFLSPRFAKMCRDSLEGKRTLPLVQPMRSKQPEDPLVEVHHDGIVVCQPVVEPAFHIPRAAVSR